MNTSDNWMPLAGGIILIVVLGYFGFQSVDAVSLPQKDGIAVVVGKEHVPPKKTYRTEYIAGRTQVLPQFNADLYVLKLRLKDTETATAVDRSLFEAANSGDQIAVTYRQRRFTGKLQITGVRPEVHP
jgi:hypothetical protein